MLERPANWRAGICGLGHDTAVAPCLHANASNAHPFWQVSVLQKTAQLGLVFTLSVQQLAAVVSNSARVPVVASSTKEVGTPNHLCWVRNVSEFTRSMCEFAVGQSTYACLVTGAKPCLEELGHHRCADRLFPFSPVGDSRPFRHPARRSTATQSNERTSRTASGAASAPLAEPSSSRGTSTAVPSPVCAATSSLSHDHQAKRG